VCWVWQGKVSLTAEAQLVVVCAKCPVDFGFCLLHQRKVVRKELAICR